VRVVVLTAIVAFAAACTTLTPADDPVFLKLTDLEARLIRIERVVENESLIELASEVSRIESDTLALRGEIETLRFEMENGQERQNTLYIDIDTRLQAMEEGQARVAEEVRVASRTAAELAAATAPPEEPPPLPTPIGNDQDNYNAAFDLIQNRRYVDAAAAFSEFLVVFPDSPLADNAQYWLAETFYVRQEFETALPEFQKVIDSYPQSAKLPDALLKVGYCYYELEQWDDARAALERVSRMYPDTTVARLAVQRLERLIQETG
jgi:tol-pal system protein YbgF